MHCVHAWENSRADEIVKYRLFMQEQQERRLKARDEEEEADWD